jgi:hypothetical protein
VVLVAACWNFAVVRVSCGRESTRRHDRKLTHVRRCRLNVHDAEWCCCRRSPSCTSDELSAWVMRVFGRAAHRVHLHARFYTWHLMSGYVLVGCVLDGKRIVVRYSSSDACPAEARPVRKLASVEPKHACLRRLGVQLWRNRAACVRSELDTYAHKNEAGFLLRARG